MSQVAVIALCCQAFPKSRFAHGAASFLFHRVPPAEREWKRAGGTPGPETFEIHKQQPVVPPLPRAGRVTIIPAGKSGEGNQENSRTRAAIICISTNFPRAFCWLPCWPAGHRRLFIIPLYC